jgi:hypothetical protein
MRDYKIVQARTLLRVHSATFIAGFVPRSIMVHGPQMSLASGVLYNGIEVLEYVISTPTSLIVRVPKSQLNEPFRELTVFSTTALTQERAQLTFALGRDKVVSGMERLVQMFLMLLFTSPGSSIFAKKSGGGFKSIIGVANANGKGTASDITMAIERTTTEILRLQARRTIPLEERLLSATLDSLVFDDRAGTAYAKVSLRNSLGESAQVQVR